MNVYKFRDCLLNTLERSVIRDSNHLDLTTKTFDVLQYLIENAGKVVTKDELLGRVWNGSFVEESNLPVHISKLRRLLGESLDRRFIETVQGTGYRFVAPLKVVGEEAWQTAILRSRDWDAGPNRSRAGIHSIAVLPLHNECADPDIEYLSDGLTEELINGLSNIVNIKVIARNTVFRYKEKQVDLQQLADTLGVRNILTGRIRIAGDDLIVSVELVSAKDGTQIWGGCYRRSIVDLMDVQEQILLSIVENLTLTELGERRQLVNCLSRNPESYRLYLKGRYRLEQHSLDGINSAVEFFGRSIALDASNIYSHVEIVECYRSLYAFGYISYEQFLQTTSAVLTSIASADQGLDVVQIVYCDLKMLEWKFDEASHYCRRALAINPNSLKGLLRYSDLLLQSRNFKCALEQLEKVMIIDPLSALLYKRIGRLLYMMGDYVNAIAYLNDALELEPGSYEALAIRGVVNSEMRNFDAALTDFAESFRTQPHLETLAMSAVVHAELGNRAKAADLLRMVEVDENGKACRLMTLAHIHLALGEKGRAYEFLEAAYNGHEPDMRALTYDRRWSGIRTEARFQALARRVGLPQLEG